MERRLAGHLHAADVLTLACLALLALVAVAFAARVPDWRFVVGVNGAAACAIAALAWTRARLGWRLLRVAHDWYLPPGAFLIFKELRWLVGPIHRGVDDDAWLIAADRWLFGTDPTRWLARLAHPFVTEVLQIAYTSFYALFVLAGLELYRRDRRDYLRLLFACLYGFYLSYAGYFLLPAVGPRFTLHGFASLDAELPGLWLTPYLRRFVDAGDSIPAGAPFEIARAAAQRDLFPSGHTMMTIVLMYWSAQFGLQSRYVIWVAGALLIIGTVYLRYHYAVDLAGGAALAPLALATTIPLFRWITRRFSTLDASPAGPEAGTIR
jgi:membrane-associated phospholipid phosphatase